MMAASGVYALIINDVSQIVNNFNLAAAEYREKCRYVNKFLASKNVPRSLTN